VEPKIDAKTNDGITVLILAVNEGHTKTAALLIDEDADITVTHNGKTFFTLANEKAMRK
jgi:ankyrin repeat protein